MFCLKKDDDMRQKRNFNRGGVYQISKFLFTFILTLVVWGGSYGADGVTFNNNVSAMQFSKPVFIGSLSYNRKDPPGFLVKNALPSSVENKYYDFGTGTDIVRMYAISPFSRAKFGDSTNESNTVEISPSQKIYEISADNGTKIYVLTSNASQGDGGGGVDVIGKYQNKKYVSYVNSKKIYDMGFQGKVVALGYGSARGPFGFQNNLSVSVDGDTIIINCKDSGYDETSRSYINGVTWKYRLKWDEAAQWFGVEYQDKDKQEENLIGKALNSTYNICGSNVTLVDGKYENSSPVYAKVGMSQNPCIGEVECDGALKTVAVFTAWYTGGGSGIFENVVAALQEDDGSVSGTKGIYIGDRVKIHNLDIDQGKIIVLYSDRFSNVVQKKVLVIRNKALVEI